MTCHVPHGVFLLPQAKAQAAKLPQYELHVLVAQPHAQDKAPKSPVQQPRMVLDGAELDSAMVNSLLEMASSKSAAAPSPETYACGKPLSEILPVSIEN